MTNKSFNEKEIVKKILAGDEKSLRRFYQYYYHSLLGYLTQKIANNEDREEILQDVFLATIEGLRDFSFRSSLFTYICGIANHKVIDYYRKKKIKSIVFSKMAGIEPLLATILRPEDNLNEEIIKQKIKDTFNKITPRYKLILKLKYIYGYSVSEIANKLAISFKSAESQLFRARKAFVEAYRI